MKSRPNVRVIKQRTPGHAVTKPKLAAVGGIVWVVTARPDRARVPVSRSRIAVHRADTVETSGDPNSAGFVQVMTGAVMACSEGSDPAPHRPARRHRPTTGVRTRRQGSTWLSSTAGTTAQRCKARIYLAAVSRSFWRDRVRCGLFAKRHNSVTCTYTFWRCMDPAI